MVEKKKQAAIGALGIDPRILEFNRIRNIKRDEEIERDLLEVGHA